MGISCYTMVDTRTGFVSILYGMEDFQMILTDELCDKLCAAARKKARK